MSFQQNSDDEFKIPQIHDAAGMRVYNGEEWGESPRNYYIGIGPWSSDTSDAENLLDNNAHLLNFLESGSTISVLEDLLQELIILKYVIGASVISSWDFKYRTLVERFTESQTPNRIFPEVDSIPVLTTPLKLQRDRQFIENVISDTLKTLLQDGTFKPIVEATKSMQLKRLDETNLIEEVKKNLEYLKDIRSRVEEKRRLEDIEEKQRDELLYRLQDEIEDVILKCSIEEKFVSKWETTRDKQNKWRLKNEEDSYRNKISGITTNLELEKIINEDMQLYIKTNQLELEEELEEWMTRYDAEMERRENKILQLKYKTDQSEEEVKRLKDLLEARAVEMEEWKKFRDIRKRRISATLMIQSWWRGFMVRKRLGPYKVKEVKEKDGKGKAK